MNFIFLLIIIDLMKILINANQYVDSGVYYLSFWELQIFHQTVKFVFELFFKRKQAEYRRVSIELLQIQSIELFQMFFHDVTNG